MKEEGGNSFGGDEFLGGAENHPLCKSMVYHDQERIKARRSGKICDEIARDLLKRLRCEGFNRRQRGYGGMRIGFVLLAFGTAFNITAYERGKTRPPELSDD